MTQQDEFDKEELEFCEEAETQVNRIKELILDLTVDYQEIVEILSS